MAVKEKPSFFQTTAGVVTGLAGVLTGVVGLLTVGTQLGWFGSDDNGDDKVQTTETTVAAGAPAPTNAGRAGGSSTGSGSNTGSAVPQFTVDPPSVTFENLGPRQQEVTLSNTGNGTITFQSPTITGPNAAQFSVTDETCNGRLDVGRTCQLEVTFAPKGGGTYTATLVIRPSGAPTREVTLKGATLL
jgi:hypothetical protein